MKKIFIFTLLLAFLGIPLAPSFSAEGDLFYPVEVSDPLGIDPKITDDGGSGGDLVFRREHLKNARSDTPGTMWVVYYVQTRDSITMRTLRDMAKQAYPKARVAMLDEDGTTALFAVQVRI